MQQELRRGSLSSCQLGPRPLIVRRTTRVPGRPAPPHASAAESSLPVATHNGTEPATYQLPDTYRRWVARRSGASFRSVAELQELPLQLPGAGEVLIHMTHAGINGGCETFRARAEFTFARPAPGTPQGQQQAAGQEEAAVVALGAEGAGVVVAVGPQVKKVKVGTPVAVNASAAFSEYCLARERLVTPLPLPLGADPGPEAAVLALSGVTAIAALEGTARIKAGEAVVVTAAAGGTGHLAVQLALLAGCHVVAVCGGQHKVQALQHLAGGSGRLTIIDHHTQDVASEVQRCFPRGVDVVYEGVGGGMREVLLRQLAPGGRFLQVGYISEYPHAQGYPHPSGTDSIAPAAATTATQAQAPAPADQPTPSSSHQGSGGDSPQQGSGDDSWDVAMAALPPAWQLFWEGRDVSGLPGGRQVYGQVWPQDARTLVRCRTRLYDLHYKQKALQVWVDTSHGLTGLEHVADAVDHMLRGTHVGKVVLQIRPPPRAAEC